MPTENVRTAPLNSFLPARAALSDAWQDIFTPPDYVVAGLGTAPATDRTVTDVILSLVVVNESGTEIQADVRIEQPISGDDPDYWPLATATPVPARKPLRLDVGKALIKSGETLQAKLATGQTGFLHVGLQRRLDPLIETI